MNLRLLLVSLLVPLGDLEASQCEQEWSNAYGNLHPEGVPLDSAVFDDGNGPELYFAGSFPWRQNGQAGSATVEAVVRFDGETLRPVGDPVLSGKGFGLEIYDDGSGPGLAVLRNNSVALYRGGAWTSLPGTFSLDSTQVGFPMLKDIVSFDDGSGPALYVSGYFQLVSGQNVTNVARFDGTSWSSVGAGLSGMSVTDMHLHDFGSGPELVAGGRFTESGGDPVGRVVRWTGTSWETVGALPPNGRVRSLTSWHDGTQNLLVAGGNFASAGGVSALRIASFDGTSWSGLGTGVDYSGGGFTQNGTAIGPYAMATEIGPGGRLIVGGLFDLAGSESVVSLAAWDGVSWSNYSEGLATQNGDLTVVEFLDEFAFDDGQASVIGGLGIGNIPVGQFPWLPYVIARRESGAWQRLAPGQGLRKLYGGCGSLLCFGGEARDGVSWDDGQGEQLYIGGEFVQAGGELAYGMARRSVGGSWGAVGGGLLNESSPGAGVRGLVAHDGPFRASTDDFSGVYAVGDFTRSSFSNTSFRGIARWDGVDWMKVDAASGSSPSFAGQSAIEVFDDGTGPRLFVGDSAGGARVHAFDGVSWDTLETPVLYSTFRTRNFGVYDDGSGPSLYLAGFFAPLTGPSTPLLKWTGTDFMPIQPPIAPNSTISEAWDLEVYDDGSGPKLWLAGSSSVSPGGPNETALASYDGSQLVGERPI